MTWKPPSNILSASGRKALLEADPDIKIIASCYLPSDGSVSCVQDYGVSEDGIINTPRIVSGTEIDDYQYLTAFSELNFQFVQSHFMHPDDALDPDRGAADGWEKMRAKFEKYFSYIKDAAPSLRNMTGTEAGEATLAYSGLSLRTSEDNGVLTADIGGFPGEAWFLLRLDPGKEPVSMTGGSFSKAAEGLWLVRADQDHLEITLG
jgi:hypothetical protein